MNLRTDNPRVVRRRLAPGDAEAYTALLHANQSRLTRLGDYTDELETPVEEYARRFTESGPAYVFGIIEGGTMVGSITLVPIFVCAIADTTVPSARDDGSLRG